MLKQKTDGAKLESLTIPQVLSKTWGIVAYSSGRYTQSVPWTKKYLPFQFLLESGMLGTSINPFFYTAKWYMPWDDTMCWGL